MSVLKQLNIPRSLKSMAFEKIKDAIMSLVFKPGEIVTEKVLAEALGISKTPVREALLELSSKGFINILDRRGVQISIITEKEIRDLYEVRRTLETEVIRLIMPKIDKASIRRLKGIHQEGSKAIRDNDAQRYLRMDREFHNTLSSITENHFLINSLENIRDLVDWMGIWALSQKRPRANEVQTEHKKLLTKISEGDLRGAIEMMEQHINITEQNVLKQLQTEIISESGGSK